MSKFINRYVIAIIGFYIFWLGILPLILSNTVTVLCQNFSHNSNYEILVKKPQIKTYLVPVIKFQSEYVSLKGKKTSEVFRAENLSAKVRLLPLLSGKVRFNRLKAEKIYLSAELRDDLILNRNFFENQRNARLNFDSVVVDNYDLRLISSEASAPVIYNGRGLDYNNRNRYLSLNVDSALSVDNTDSRIFVNLFLPKDNNINRTNFDIDISNLNLEPLGIFFKNFLPKEIVGLKGFVNISANRDELITEFTKTAVLMKEKDNSIIFPEKLVVKSTFNIRQDLINIKNLEVNSDRIHLIVSGRIRDYFGETMPTVDLKVIVNKSKIEDFVNMIPPFKVEEFDAYKLKKYKFYGDVIGNLAIKGRFPEPDINGSVFIDNGILIKPIPDTTKGATVKLTFNGRQALYDVFVPAGGIQKVWVNGNQELYNVKYGDVNVKSTQNVNLQSAENVVNPLHEILNFIIGPVPILDVKGTGNIDINVKGNRAKPHVWGSLNFYNADVRFIKIPDLQLKGADAVLTFNDTSATFKTFKGQVNGKDFNISGVCDLSGNFDFDAVSQNQPSDALYHAIETSTMIDDVKKMLPKFDRINGLTDLNLKIYGTVKEIEDMVFNKNAFAKGSIKVKNNSLVFDGIDITSANADIKLDGTAANAEINASAGGSPLTVSAKVKNEFGDVVISIPRFNANYLLQDKEYRDKNYLPNVEVNAKYKGNINRIEYDKLNFTSKILPQNKPSFFDFKSGEISLLENKLNLKNLVLNIKDSQNSIAANLQIADVFSPKPLPNGTLKLNISDMKVLNEIFGEKILPENLHNLLKDYEFERGSLKADARFVNGKLFTDCDLSGIAFNYLPPELPIEILNGRLSAWNNNVKLNKINILADKMPILADGEIKDITGKRIFDIYINSKPKQEFIDKFINKNRIYPLKIKGDIIYNTTFRGVPENYDLQAKVDMSKDSSIYYYGATVGDLENSIVLNLDSKIKNNKEVRIKDFLYDKMISSQNGKQTRLNMLKVRGGFNLLKDDIDFKDLCIKTSHPTDAKIFNLLFGKPNIKQGQFTSDLKLRGRLSNPKILGDFHIVETNIPFLDTIMKNIEFVFRENTLEINSKGEVLGNDISAKAVLKNKLTKPYHIENAVITAGEMNLNRIADKLKSAELDNTQLQDTFGVFDVNSIIADNLILKADKIFLRNIHATDFQAETSLNKQHLFEIKKFVFNIAQGNLSGKYSYNLNNNNLNLEMKADSISANDITWAIFDLQNQIYGDLTGSIKLSCNGENFEKCMQTLNGDTVFNVKDGKMPKLGSLEYLLRAGNLVKGGITSLSVNNVISLISPLRTGEFTDIYGVIGIKDGIAETLEISTQGKDLSLFISGIYDFSTAIADMQVLGMLSRKISSMLGPIGNLSVNTLFNIIPGVDLAKESSVLDKINRIPGIELSEKTYRKFVADIKGNINEEDYVTSFKWIN